ncbi:MAG: hypothetical protein RJA19_1648 [Bacteroidota bacterium]|jgi:hypothetical protein
MNDFRLDGTSKTPKVELTVNPFAMHLSGRSIPENSIEFYRPLMDWVATNCDAGKPRLEINIRLEYFNTSSSKCLMDLLKRVESSGNEAVVNWFYEEDDEDMLEAGEDYDEIIELPFRLIATEAH